MAKAKETKTTKIITVSAATTKLRQQAKTLDGKAEQAQKTLFQIGETWDKVTTAYKRGSEERKEVAEVAEELFGKTYSSYLSACKQLFNWKKEHGDKITDAIKGSKSINPIALAKRVRDNVPETAPVEVKTRKKRIEPKDKSTNLKGFMEAPSAPAAPAEPPTTKAEKNPLDEIQVSPDGKIVKNTTPNVELRKQPVKLRVAAFNLQWNSIVPDLDKVTDSELDILERIALNIQNEIDELRKARTKKAV